VADCPTLAQGSWEKQKTEEPEGLLRPDQTAGTIHDRSLDVESRTTSLHVESDNILASGHSGEYTPVWVADSGLCVLQIFLQSPWGQPGARNIEFFPAACSRSGGHPVR